jgi:beta-mannanase
VGGGTANQPADLVAAWRHIHDRFAAAGARNVRFVWCPDGVNMNPALLRAAYPGDAYVDFACWDTYDYDPTADYQALSAITQKPFVLAEVGSKDPAWVRGLAAKLNANQLSRIRAVVWFDEGEWRLDASPPVLAATRAMLAGPAFS